MTRYADGQPLDRRDQQEAAHDLEEAELIVGGVAVVVRPRSSARRSLEVGGVEPARACGSRSPSAKQRGEQRGDAHRQEDAAPREVERTGEHGDEQRRDHLAGR